MPPSESEDENEVNEDLDFDGRSSEAEEMNDEELFDGDDNAEDASEREEDSASEDEEEEGEEEEEEEEEETQKVVVVEAALKPPMPMPEQPSGPSALPYSTPSRQRIVLKERTPEQREVLSPALLRRSKLVPSVLHPRSYTVEAICAIAHPEPTHALTASTCMSHLLTGSQDGYIRDYDVFSAVNGKTFLTAPQRAHCQVVEGTMKSGQLRTWWENPAAPAGADDIVEDTSRSPATSLAMHSDALWALAGTEKGHVNLFTVRHDPGQFITALYGHRGPVSSLAVQHDEMGFFSAGWDGDVYQWDLNTGQQARKFRSHGAQVAIVAVRPLGPLLPPPTEAPAQVNRGGKAEAQEDEDMNSEASFDPLFDDEPDADESIPNSSSQDAGLLQLPAGKMAPQTTQAAGAATATTRARASHPRGPPVLDADAYGAYSLDVLMTASVDGAIVLWDRRVNDAGRGVGRLEMSIKTPPWCVSACWSADGGQVYAGRRNSTVDVWDTRMFGQTVPGVPRLLKTLRNPISSGAVSCVAAFPDGRHIAVASNDNIRLWNASEAVESDGVGPGGGGGGGGRGRSGVPFKIIPGHHGGIISQILIDPGARFMVTASSNRGWSGESTRTVLIHDIKSLV